jgi:hypothetical protein
VDTRVSCVVLLISLTLDRIERGFYYVTARSDSYSSFLLLIKLSATSVGAFLSNRITVACAAKVSDGVDIIAMLNAQAPNFCCVCVCVCVCV